MSTSGAVISFSPPRMPSALPVEFQPHSLLNPMHTDGTWCLRQRSYGSWFPIFGSSQRPGCALCGEIHSTLRIFVCRFFEHDYEHRPEKQWPEHEHENCAYRPCLCEQVPAAESGPSFAGGTWAGLDLTTNLDSLRIKRLCLYECYVPRPGYKACDLDTRREATVDNG